MTKCHNFLSDSYRGWKSKLMAWCPRGWFALRAGREGSVPCLQAAGGVRAIVGLQKHCRELYLHLHVVRALGVGLCPDSPFL